MHSTFKIGQACFDKNIVFLFNQVSLCFSQKYFYMNLSYMLALLVQDIPSDAFSAKSNILSNQVIVVFEIYACFKFLDSHANCFFKTVFWKSIFRIHIGITNESLYHKKSAPSFFRLNIFLVIVITANLFKWCL